MKHIITKSRIHERILCFCILVTAFYGFYNTSYAQSKTSCLYEEDVMNKISPSAPTAESLGKYGNHPVDLSIGLVPITIDLFTVVSGELKVPIRLTYHGGGIKVREKGSWVGMGWDLDFGGSVVRTLYGQPDECEYEGILDSIDVQDLSRNSASIFKYWKMSIGHPGYTYMPDLFSYRIGDYCGTFFVKTGKQRVGSVRPDTIVPVSYTSIRGYNFLEGNHEIISPDGTKYDFDESERTNIHIKASSLSKNFVSTYYVKRITSPNGQDSIRYEYQSGGGSTTVFQMAYQGAKYSHTYSLSGNDDFSLRTQTKTTGTHTTQPISSTISLSMPKYIYFPEGRLEFVLEDRDDCLGKCLKNISVEKLEYGRYEVTRRINFNYLVRNQSDTDTNIKRMFLESVTESNSDSTECIILGMFEYCKGYMPAKNSFSYDYWGYCNGRTTDAYGIPPTELSDGSTVGNYDKTPNEDYMKTGTMTKITYPTGGYSVFEWEINRTSTYLYGTNNSSGNYPFAGLRIKSIKKYDRSGALVCCKDYCYTDSDGHSTGYITTKNVNLSNVKKETNVLLAGGRFVITRNEFAYSNNQYGPKENNFAYSMVKEAVRSSEDSNSSICKCYYFNQCDDTFFYEEMPTISMAHKRNYLLKEEVYECTPSSSTLLKEVDNTYSADPRISIRKKGLAVISPHWSFGSNGDTAAIMFYLNHNFETNMGISDIFTALNYTYTSEWMHLDKSVVKERMSDGTYVTNTTEYKYGSPIHLQPTEILKSNGFDKIKDTFAYPSDVTENTMDKMVSKNMLQYVIEQKEYRQPYNETMSLIDGIHKNYTISDGNIVLASVDRYQRDGSKYRLYDYTYNAVGRLIEYRGIDMVNTTIYWDEKNIHPLVFIKNKPYDSRIEAFAKNSYIPYTLYSNPLCKGGEVTAYTYAPLIGVTSITHPNGYKTFYSYDSFGRLIGTEDNDHHVVKAFEYNYAK